METKGRGLQMLHDDLKRRRERLGMTKNALARELLVTRQTFNNWESGTTKNLHPLLRNAWIAALEKAEKFMEEVHTPVGQPDPSNQLRAGSNHPPEAGDAPSSESTEDAPAPTAEGE